VLTYGGGELGMYTDTVSELLSAVIPGYDELPIRFRSACHRVPQLLVEPPVEGHTWCLAQLGSTNFCCVGGNEYPTELVTVYMLVTS
jgi:hypothetical protein